MNTILSLLSLLLCFLYSFPASEIIEGNDTTFDGLVQKGVVLAQFYAPWCGHCSKLKPEWKSAAKTLKNQATFVSVDATHNEALAKKYSIRAFPTIKFFSDGNVVEYNGSHTAQALVDFTKTRLSSPVQVIENEESLSTLRRQHPFSVVLFTKTNESDIFQVFERQANALRDEAVFGVVYNATLHKGHVEDSVMMFRNSSEQCSYDKKLTDREAFVQWIRSESFPLLEEITPENFDRYFRRGLPLAWLFLDPSAQESSDKAKELVRSVATHFKDSLSMIFLPVDNENYVQMVRRLGLSGAKYPVFSIEDNKNRYYTYPEDKELTGVALLSFCKNFLQGTLERTHKSQPIPENPVKGGLITVVGKSFSSVVKNSQKDVFLELYAPWCGHCQTLEPIIAELAVTLKNVPTIVIAKMDATENDPPDDYEIIGFPSLYFIPAGKERISYEGERSVAGILRFLKAHATHPFDA